MSKKLITRQISTKLEQLKDSFNTVRGINSWSKYIREALGMSGGQLAKRLGLAANSLSSLETREIEDRLTLGKLKELANALECELVYAFIPKKPLEEVIHQQAKLKALKSLSSSDTHMQLEDQAVTSDYQQRLEDLIIEKKSSKYLWDSNE